MTPVIELSILLLTPLVPLALALALLLFPDSRTLAVLGAWAALPALVTSWWMVPGIAANVPWILQGSEFGLDSVGRVFLFFSAVIWLVGGLYARFFLIAPGHGRFMALFLLVMSGNLGLIVARDMLAFYTFFTLMSLGAYGLVVHERNQNARYAGRVYATFVMAGDMAILVALMLAARDTDGLLVFEAIRATLVGSPQQNLIIALLVLGFGIKTGLLGVHVTLPLIYRAAPLPATIVLAGAMINAGLFAWLRFLPIGHAGFENWGIGLMFIGGTAAFYAAFVGVLQRNPKSVLAYSSISQLGILTLATGVCLLAPARALDVLLVIAAYAMHHAFAKASLFIGTGIAEHGLAPRWLTALGLLLPALALAGAPLTTGMLVKEALKEVLILAPEPWASAAKHLLPWMAVATTCLLARFLWLVVAHTRIDNEHSRETRGALLGVWMVMVMLSLVAAWFAPLTVTPGLWNAASVWEVSWPILLGAALAILCDWLARRGGLTWLPVLPAGDVLIGIQAIGRLITRAWLDFARMLPRGRFRLRQLTLKAVKGPPWRRWTAQLEAAVTNWITVTLLLPLLILIAASLIAW